MKLRGLPPMPGGPIKPATLPNTAPVVTLTEEVKAQPVRLLDVALFAPLTILGALNKEPPTWMRLALLAYGVGTLVYNAHNFLEIERRRKLTQNA